MKQPEKNVNYFSKIPAGTTFNVLVPDDPATKVGNVVSEVPTDDKSTNNPQPVWADLPAGTYKKGEQMWVVRQEDWNRLSSALGVNLKDTTDLCTHVEAMSHIRVEGVDIRLEPGLLHRLRSRCIRKDFNVFLSETVLTQLHAWVGW